MSIQEIDRTAYPSIGPRVTPEAIEANIANEYYFTAKDGAIAAGVEPDHELPESLKLLTICVLELQNGFTVTGESACADPRNFNREIGQKVARQNAINKIWPLMGYMLRSKLHEAMHTGTDLGEALTHLLAYELGNHEALKPGHVKTILAHFEGRALQEEGGN